MITRSELINCSVWTLIVGVILVPTAMVLGSGHAPTGIVVAILATLFLLPAVASWELVGMPAGPVIGGITAAIAQFAWIFLWVYLVRRVIVNRRKSGATDAR